MLWATKIRMEEGKENDDAIGSIKAIYLKNDLSDRPLMNSFYTPEAICNILKDNPSIEIKVNIEPYPHLIREERHGKEYVKSAPDDTGKDNLLALPRV